MMSEGPESASHPQHQIEGDVPVDEIDLLDDGGAEVGQRGLHDAPPSSGELPMVVSARELFAAVGEPAVTGDSRVDAASARLSEVLELPTSDHVAVYDDVHRRLQDALADADVR